MCKKECERSVRSPGKFNSHNASTDMVIYFV